VFSWRCMDVRLCVSRIDPIRTTNTPLQPVDLSWCVRVAHDKREIHRTTFLRCHRLCEALLDSSRIYCLVSGLVVLAWLAGCVFPGRGCRHVNSSSCSGLDFM
jgi:hypothetical protein